MSRELGAMREEFGESFAYRHVQVIGEVAPKCWKTLRERLDNAVFPWNFVWFLEDDVEIPEGGLAALFMEIFKARDIEPMVMASTYATSVHRYNRGGRIGAIKWRANSQHYVHTTGWYCLLADRRAWEIQKRPDSEPPMGQDVRFCQAVNRAGMRIVAVPGVEIPHRFVKTFVYKKFTSDGWSGVHLREAY